MNVYHRVIDIIVAIIILFLVPSIYFMQKSDQLAQSIAYDNTKSFANQIETYGYLSKEMYEDYIKSLSFIDAFYEVHIEHTETIHEPIYNTSGVSGTETNVFTGDIMSYQRVEYTEELLQCLYDKQSNYLMGKGDVIKITVVVKSNGFFKKLFHKSSTDGYRSYALYYGIIRN